MKTYPPFLDQIHEHCPKAAFMYTKIWRERDAENNSILYRKEQIQDELFLTWKSFRHLLMLLKKERVLTCSFSHTQDKVKITMNNPSDSIENVA